MAITLRICRRILRELKRTDPEGVGGAPWHYITTQVRLHRNISDERVIFNYQRLLQTYLSYIEGSRQHRELLSRYQGKGERSVEESAKIVGLQLPDAGLPAPGTETGSHAKDSR